MQNETEVREESMDLDEKREPYYRVEEVGVAFFTTESLHSAMMNT